MNAIILCSCSRRLLQRAQWVHL